MRFYWEGDVLIIEWSDEERLTQTNTKDIQDRGNLTSLTKMVIIQYKMKWGHIEVHFTVALELRMHDLWQTHHYYSQNSSGCA